MELIMWIQSGSERVNGLFFRLLVLKLLNFILNLFLFDHDLKDNGEWMGWFGINPLGSLWIYYKVSIKRVDK